MDPASSAAATLLLFGVLGPGAADAQATAVTGAARTAVSKPAPSAYTQLSPGDQKIALALYDAQAKSTTARQLTLDQISAMKQRGQRWGQVFNTMKAQGLVHDESLARLVSSANRRSHQTSASSVVSASPKAHPKSRPEHSLSADDGPSAGLGSADSGSTH